MTAQVLDKDYISKKLEAVGGVIIAVAILDVAKYMIEEEVLRSKELRSSKEARETLTKITVIVAIAVSIEALIYIFKAGAEDIRLLVYPGFLLICVVLLIVGLGIYQKLSFTTEKNSEVTTDPNIDQSSLENGENVENGDENGGRKRGQIYLRQTKERDHAKDGQGHAAELPASCGSART